MANSIYITTAEPHCGKSLICLGIMDNVLRRTKRVSFFRPIITSNDPDKKDKNIELILSHFQLDQSYDDAYAFHQKEAQELISAGQTNELLDRIIQKYKHLETKSDFILCEGTDFIKESSAFEFGINIQVAKNLGSPVLVIGRGDLGRSPEEALTPVRLAIESFHEQDYDVMGAIINRTDPEKTDQLLEAMNRQWPSDKLLRAVIPSVDLLKSPTVSEVVNHLNAKVLYGKDQLNNQVYRYSIAAMQLQNYLTKLTENCLIITPGDRGEIILGTLQAHQSKNYPQIAAIVLSTGLDPDPAISKLLDGIPDIIPILSVESNTYDTATALNQIHAYITPNNMAKIHASLRLFDEYVDMEQLESRTSRIVSRGMTPRMFQYILTQKARSAKKHIVLPEGEDERILKAAEILVEQGIVNLTLLGLREEIEKKILMLGLNLTSENINIIEPEQHRKFDDYVDTFYNLRKEKGITRDMAKDAMMDVSYFGTMMVYQGDADGMVSGAVHTTQHTIRPALQFVKTKPGYAIVSSLFFMCLEDRVLAYADCAINPNPNAAELAEIAIATAHTARAFGIEPRVAMLSYSSGKSGQGADVEKVREATEIVQSKNPDFKIEGPLQYDAAVDLEVGEKKVPGSEVAGKATVLIFPDLNTGNNTYKAVQRETGAVAIGPVLQGLNKPVNDLSRGCTVTDIVNTVIITAIQAQSN
ncbi:phosphate acetyltransferase [Fulvivirga sedimenti]|uniref:Phosphate acetyltransferase n=1 Tax=Fulvivirga sedimenti TaxID=2879465 RepID=A0A9X1HVB0_9BACT|nr:phosphate acetyltransferase [Fulvivirga sedimenti]MCA6078939.1 phosphate acetyltransferase [Fulvivirga sedimenti]